MAIGVFTKFLWKGTSLYSSSIMSCSLPMRTSPSALPNFWFFLTLWIRWDICDTLKLGLFLSSGLVSCVWSLFVSSTRHGVGLKRKNTYVYRGIQFGHVAIAKMQSLRWLQDHWVSSCFQWKSFAHQQKKSYHWGAWPLCVGCRHSLCLAGLAGGYVLCLSLSVLCWAPIIMRLYLHISII